MRHSRFPVPRAAGESPIDEDRERSWYRLAATRIAADWTLKFGASVLFTAVFFVGYFLLLKYPVFEATAMPVLAWDRLVPFQPGALWVYASLWLYVQIAPALLLQRSAVIAFGKALLGLSGAGFFFFFFWPTKLAASSIDWRQHAAFQTLKEVDASGNACPSLHVAFALFTAFSLERTLREIHAPTLLRGVNTLWCLGIIYSTLATRQHVLLDVLGGSLLAVVTWLIYGHFVPLHPPPTRDR